MTLTEFYHNPSGKGATALNISAIKSQYDDRYEQISDKLTHRMYKTNNNYFIKVLFPSMVDGILYDVVIQFKAKSQDELDNASINIFSNSPSFVYTYLYAYDKHGLFIKELRNKVPSDCFKKQPKEKNPYNMISFDFSVYSAIKYIIDNDILYGKDVINANKTQIFKTIKNFNEIQSNRKSQKDINKAIEEEKKQNEKISVKESKKMGTIKITPRVNVVKNTKKVKKI